MIATSMRRVAGLIGLALVSALLLVPVTLDGGAAHAATVTNQTCLVTDYIYKIRNVTHKAPVWATYRVNWESFGARTQISTGRTLAHRSSSNVRTSAGVSGTVSGSYSEDAIIEKVEVKASISADYRRKTGSTSSESQVVTTQQRTWVPAGTTLITFKARKVIHGTYQLSTCERQPGQSARFGKVVWRTHSWSTYSTPGRGQWNCTAKAQNPPERMAQKIAGCFS